HSLPQTIATATLPGPSVPAGGGVCVSSLARVVWCNPSARRAAARPCRLDSWARLSKFHPAQASMRRKRHGGKTAKAEVGPELAPGMRLTSAAGSGGTGEDSDPVRVVPKEGSEPRPGIGPGPERSESW